MFVSRYEFVRKIRSIDESNSTWTPKIAYAVMEISDYHHWLNEGCDPEFAFRIYYNHMIEGNDFAFPAFLTSEVIGDTNDPGEGFLGCVTPEGNVIMGSRGEVDEIYVNPNNLPWLGVYPETCVDDDGNLYYLDLDEEEMYCSSPEWDDGEECDCEECQGCCGCDKDCNPDDEVNDIKINMHVNKENKVLN
jgi:hypothetical protein